MTHADQPDSPARIGVCSWSLGPASPAQLVERARAVGVRAVQLALDPIRTGAWELTATRGRLADAGIAVPSGMMAMAGEDYSTLASIRATGGVVPDATWQANLDAARANAGIAHELGITLVSFHAGFVPHDRADPARAELIARLGTLAEVYADAGVAVALETGQEAASTLVGVLDELPGIGVNLDPANMILYGMGDPVAAMDTLAGRVVQLHAKDAVAAHQPGRWGAEVPVGTGAVDWAGLVAAAGRGAPGSWWMIEREAGDDRIADARRARAVLIDLLASDQP